MRRAALVLTLFGLVAASCGGSSSERDYDVAVRNAFLENCQYEGGDPSSCAASLECIEEQLTQEEFEYEENWLFLRGEFSDRMTDVLATCMVEAAALTESATTTMATTATKSVSGIGDCDTVDSVSVQLQWFTQAQFAGYYAAVDKGIYEKYCLDVTVLEGGVDIAPQQQLASGAVDFAVSWVPKALVVREQGADVVNVAQIFQRSGTLQVSWADSGINTPGDLAGKVVGNWGWGNEFELLAGARSVGLDPSTDFELVQQSFDMMALLTGEIDAAQAMIYNEYPQLLEAVNPATGELFKESDFSTIDWNDVGTAMLQDAIWADGARLADASYQDLTRRFIAGSLEGWMYCRDNSSECVDIVLANGSALGASHQAWQMNEVNALIWPSPHGVGMMDHSLWAQTIHVATTERILGAVPDTGAYTTEFALSALQILESTGYDPIGENWQKMTVRLRQGGQ